MYIKQTDKCGRLIAILCKAAEGRRHRRSAFKARLAHTPHLIGPSTKSQTKDM